MSEYTAGQLQDLAHSPSLETVLVTLPAQPSPPIAHNASILARTSAAPMAVLSLGVSAEPSPTLP